jgi:hypothetical protein
MGGQACYLRHETEAVASPKKQSKESKESKVESHDTIANPHLIDGTSYDKALFSFISANQRREEVSVSNNLQLLKTTLKTASPEALKTERRSKLKRHTTMDTEKLGTGLVFNTPGNASARHRHHRTARVTPSPQTRRSENLMPSPSP